MHSSAIVVHRHAYIYVKRRRSYTFYIRSFSNSMLFSNHNLMSMLVTNYSDVSSDKFVRIRAVHVVDSGPCKFVLKIAPEVSFTTYVIYAEYFSNQFRFLVPTKRSKMVATRHIWGREGRKGKGRLREGRKGDWSKKVGWV